MDQFLKLKTKTHAPAADADMEEDDDLMRKAKEMPKFVPWVEK